MLKLSRGIKSVGKSISTGKDFDNNYLKDFLKPNN